MPRWLSEDPIVVYAILGAAALVVLALAWMNRDRAIPFVIPRDRRREPRSIGALTLGGFIVLVLAFLAGGAWLIDRLIETDREQIEQAVREMVEGVKTGDTERVFTHVSAKYQGPPASSKESFKTLARHYIEQGGVTDIPMWDFQREGEPAGQTCTVSFLFKVKGGPLSSREDLHWRCRAVFVLDSDGRWRLQSFQLLNPASGDIMPLPH